MYRLQEVSLGSIAFSELAICRSAGNVLVNTMHGEVSGFVNKLLLRFDLVIKLKTLHSNLLLTFLLSIHGCDLHRFSKPPLPCSRVGR